MRTGLDWAGTRLKADVGQAGLIGGQAAAGLTEAARGLAETGRVGRGGLARLWCGEAACGREATPRRG